MPTTELCASSLSWNCSTSQGKTPSSSSYRQYDQVQWLPAVPCFTTMESPCNQASKIVSFYHSHMPYVKKKKNPHRTEKINSTPGKPDPPLKFPTLTSPLQKFASKTGYSMSQECIPPLKTSHTHTLSMYLCSVINSNFLFHLISKFLFKWWQALGHTGSQFLCSLALL